MTAAKMDLKALAEELVQYGRKRGASEVEVTATDGASFRVSVRDGVVETLSEAGSTGVSLRVFAEGRVATASSSDLSTETLHRVADRAIERARLSGTDPFAGLPDLEKVAADAVSLKLWDPKIPEMAPEAKIEWAKKLESIGLKDKRIGKSMGAGFSSHYWTVALANSKGFSGSYTNSAASTNVAYQAGEGQNLFQEGWYDSSRTLAGLLPAEAVAARAVDRATRLIGARKVETQNVPVILEPTMTGELLGFLARCLDGEAVNQKQSFLAGKVGEKIGSDLVNVVDDGLLPGGLGTSPFDDEGVPRRRTVLFEKGVLKSYLLDTYQARKMKAKSTGNGGGPTNFALAAGASKPEEILKSVEKGLYLTGTMGQGTVASTGDISRGAFGLWIEKGEVVHPVAEITISGNLGRMLKDLVMAGDDLDFRQTVTGPTVKIAEMTIGGK
jgi:PmbA protein